MRRCTKGKEPKELIEFRVRQPKPHPRLDNPPSGLMDALRHQLVRDQQGLCVYCERRIEPSSQAMKVEHFKPQSKHPEARLRWSNLYGVCLGNPGPPKFQTCDTKKADSDCELDPATVDETSFRYSNNGTVHHDRHQDPDIDKVLNLNARHLVRARKEVWGQYTQRSKWGTTAFERELSALQDSKTKLSEFAGMKAYFLRKQLRRKGGR